MAVDVITIVFRTYLIDQTIDHLASTLKRGGIKDLLLFFPQNKRDDRILDEMFRKQGIPQVADWWTKKKYVILKEGIIKAIQGSLEEGDSDEEVSPHSLVIYGVTGFLTVVPSRSSRRLRRDRKNSRCQKLS